MAMSAGQGSEEHDEVMSSINTTPLVDVMLVLLIIFLLTIPVVTHSVNVKLPTQTVQPLQTTPQNIVLAVNRDGDVFWSEHHIDMPTLVARLKQAAVQQPQPEIHIRGDENARYEFVGKVVVACERAGIVKVDFITNPAARGG
ncbi:biopolymer transporter ExbD [Caballeronia udeis]|uniref:Biopolymer transporter ExbD n=1 Tax=Caballeronia udeis TaxID=1232866 RepID=A0A158ICT1_9BURK|nr:biopolymer transporter ExbD [Caballeronia udeis]SAL54395.1 biopolymer transporter ExbD [Caballeronia udeis]